MMTDDVSRRLQRPWHGRCIFFLMNKFSFQGKRRKINGGYAAKSFAEKRSIREVKGRGRDEG